MTLNNGRLLRAVALAALLVLFVGCGGSEGPPGEPGISVQGGEVEVAQAGPDGLVRVIVTLESRAGDVDRRMVANAGGRARHMFRHVNGMSAEIPEQAIEALRRNPRVIAVDRAAIMRTANPDHQELPWGVARIDERWADNEFAGSNRGEGVLVAIIDSGIDYEHPDLADNYDAAPGYNFVNDTYDAMDDNGHGTHVAGTVAAIDNDFGVVGVAPEATISAYKVLAGDGSGNEDDLIAALEASIENDVDVVNMSMGSTGASDLLEKACAAAADAGVVLVAAAGNNGMRQTRFDNVLYPARYDSVIAVGATDQGDQRPRWSSTGPSLELCAPGSFIYSTYLTNAGTPTGYRTMSGTSMAAPHVSGAAALAVASGLSGAAVRARLVETADDLGPSGWDPAHGYGIVDADEAAGDVVEVVERTDVAIAAVEAPSSVLVETSVDVTVTVKNVGTQDVGSFSVTLSKGETAIGTQTVDALSAGASEEILFEWTPRETGDHVLTASHNLQDDDASNDSMNVTVSVTEEQQDSGGMYVGDIQWGAKGPHLAVKVTVLVDEGTPVAGATVKMNLEGPNGSSSFSGTTDSAGQVEFMEKRAPRGDYRATVNDVTHDTYEYNPELDVNNPSTHTF